ncbi:GNAT family N-acetyltransferase [Streptomyces kebangsaanensis]|uniref:GNAT family N-acetyltransferase n=1 Tax=Streptomyces kebangsaanensis TaxID=864058 RepID=UPI00093E6A01|nr:GNAT family N-acetyltransferase [Streptomyces kebangsaanensis]
MPILTGPVLPAGTFARIPQPTLSTGDDLLLRPPRRPEDAPAVHAVFQDPVMHRWHTRAAGSGAEAADRIEERRAARAADRAGRWAVTDADGGRPVGRVAPREARFEDGAAEVAYRTVPAARATAALTRWALEETGFHRLELLHAVRDEASCRVAAGTGFALEGTERSSGLHPEGRHDMRLHARVRGDGR